MDLKCKKRHVCLHFQIKQLEDKIKEQEQQLACMVTDSDATKSLRSSPPGSSRCSSRDDLTSDIEQRILKSSNTVNRQATQGSTLLKGKDSVPQVRRKRLSTNSEAENNGVLPASVHDRTEQDYLQEARRKRLSRNGEVEKNVSNDRRTRQSDPPRPAATGVTRGMKSTTTTTTTNAQRPLIRNKMNREPIQGAKEKDTKKRMWTR